MCVFFVQFYSSYNGMAVKSAPADHGGFPRRRLRDIAERLYSNEYPQGPSHTEKSLRPSDAALAKQAADHSFPYIVADTVEKIIQDGLAKQVNKWAGLRAPQSVVIPLGYSSVDSSTVALGSTRKVEVMANCIGHIFEGRINDANKVWFTNPNSKNSQKKTIFEGEFWMEKFLKKNVFRLNPKNVRIQKIECG